MSKNKLQIWQDWYTNNNKEYNKKRKARYKTDKQYRQKALNNSASNRSKEIKRAEYQIRIYKNKEVKVYSINNVCKYLNITPKYIQLLESKGVIPICIFTEHRRIYTFNQVSLLKELLKFMKTENEFYLKYKYEDQLNDLIMITIDKWGNI